MAGGVVMVGFAGGGAGAGGFAVADFVALGVPAAVVVPAAVGADAAPDDAATLEAGTLDAPRLEAGALEREALEALAALGSVLSGLAVWWWPLQAAVIKARALMAVTVTVALGVRFIPHLRPRDARSGAVGDSFWFAS